MAQLLAEMVGAAHRSPEQSDAAAKADREGVHSNAKRRRAIGGTLAERYSQADCHSRASSAAIPPDRPHPVATVCRPDRAGRAPTAPSAFIAPTYVATARQGDMAAAGSPAATRRGGAPRSLPPKSSLARVRESPAGPFRLPAWSAVSAGNMAIAPTPAAGAQW